MTSVRPRQLVHRGTVLVHGYLVDPALLGHEASRRRVLALWSPGAQVEQRGEQWLLRLAIPKGMSVSACSAGPLVRQGALLTAAPLSSPELERLAANAGDIVHIRDGVAETLPPSAERVDLASWLEVASFTVERVTGLGAPPAAISVLAPVSVERGRFAVPPAAPELASVMAALRREPRPLAAPAGAAAPMGSGEAPGRPTWWTNLLELLGLSPRGRSRPALPPPLPTSGVALTTRSAPERPWFERLRAAMARWLAGSRLASVLGQRQAEYLVRMMEMFQDGDFDAALRHAIPLSSREGGAEVMPALGVPAPRSVLAIGMGNTPTASSSMGLAPTLFAHLQQMYRNAVAQLERAGRIEEAAFVLAELLQASGEAVAFLERHGRLRLAAELAEGRGLAPELVVRQWFVAQEVERAVAVARRTGCFAAAVVQLEKKEPERGRALRLLWAETLAEAGDYAAAVLAIWPVAEARSRAKAWVERALALGGVVEAAMLVRQVVLTPAALETARVRVDALCDEASLEAAPARRAFVEALAANDPTPETSALARAGLRSHLRDRAAGHTGADPRLLTRLQGLAADPVLQADLPPMAALVRGRSTPPFHTLMHAAADVGTLALRDVALLPGGRLLVALGEAGVRLLTPDGRLISHFDLPAEHLVVSDTGARAIGLAARGGGWRLSRFDLAARTADAWCEARLDSVARDFDGSLWFVASEGAVQAVDATSSRLKALWRVGELGGRVQALGRSAKQLSFLVGGESAGLWQYDLPGLALRSRVLPEVVKLAGAQARFASWMGNGLAALSQVEGVAPFEALRLDAPGAAWRDSPVLFTAPHLAPAGLICGGGWVVAAARQAEGIRVHVIAADRRPVATFELDGSTSVTMRLGPDDTLAVADDRGRVIVYQLEQGVLLRDLRVG